eukprot:CAMPEP_0201888004 /NCGR_PEP_ID=MMETSP0902-20130614/26416_1 /ASSEMBLY_ACC=CAM_ASM_000551 /TAXON_ID=420261 /ORGANISM="Thalassiosira antarctica, Strain CCMP982" /LENGTH=65 /DNA_ID=CAMNT_0048418115 /DNA_START=651 /DNA_END=845 /DNA_ORIENTATION=-
MGRPKPSSSSSEDSSSSSDSSLGSTESRRYALVIALSNIFGDKIKLGLLDLFDVESCFRYASTIW